MALPNLRKDWIGKATAVAMMGLAALPAVTATTAHAGDINARPTAAWTPQLRELHAASMAARQYAEANDGVGILFHIGRDLSGRADADTAIQTVEDYFVQQFAARGIEAKAFTSMNDARATGITYHIDKLIHGAHNGTEVKDLKEALDAIPSVIDQLHIAKSIAAAVGGPRPALPGG